MTGGDDRTDEMIALEQARARLAVSPYVNPGARERTQRREDGAESGAGPGQTNAVEATVTFVIREPVASSRRRTPPFDPASPLIGAGEGPQRPFVLPNRGIDEAEVEIIGPETNKAPTVSTDRPKGALRRFLETLTGS